VPGPGAGATARRDRWARLRRHLWQPPRPHGEQPRERVVGPLELFYDLAVVVLVAQAARHLAGHLTWRGLGEFVVVFTLVWIAWANGSLHHELHGHDDARSRSTFLIQILVLAAIGACIPQAGGARGAAFAIAAAVLFAVLAILWLLAARGDRPEYRRSSRLFVTGTAACAVLLASTALLPASARVPAWGLLDAAYLAGFAAVILTATPGASLTVTDALIERFGTLTIIVLGETLTGVVAGLASQPISAVTLAVGLTAVVVGFGAWWTYFDFAGQRRPRPTQPATAQWMLSHCPSRLPSPPWAPRWSASSTTPTTAAPPSPAPGSCAQAPPSCCARPCWYPRACKPGTATAACTSRSAARAPPWPWPASASAPHGQRRFSSGRRSFYCLASHGDSPSHTAWQILPDHPKSNPCP
jgi:low temperature requirement protein LtrA